MICKRQYFVCGWRGAGRILQSRKWGKMIDGCIAHPVDRTSAWCTLSWYWTAADPWHRSSRNGIQILKENHHHFNISIIVLKNLDENVLLFLLKLSLNHWKWWNWLKNSFEKEKCWEMFTGRVSFVYADVSESEVVVQDHWRWEVFEQVVHGVLTAPFQRLQRHSTKS